MSSFIGNPQSTSSGGAFPGPAQAAKVDALANPSVSEIGAILQGFNGATWDRLRSGGDNADGVATITLGLLRMLAEAFVWNGATWDRIRQPNSWLNRAIKQSAISITTTGVKASFVAANPGFVEAANFVVTTQTNGAAVIALQKVSGGVTYTHQYINVSTASPVGQAYDALMQTEAISGITAQANHSGPMHYAAGDTVQITVITAAATAGNGDFKIDAFEERAAF